MPANSWSALTIVFFVVVAVIFTVVGFVIGKLMQGKKSAELSTQLDQSQQELQKVAGELAFERTQLKAAESQIHQKELAENTLQQRLATASAIESRLENELGDRKASIDMLTKRIEEVTQKQHDAERQYQAAQTEIGALNTQQSELRDRLQKAETTLTEERREISKLKDDLAEEGKKAKALEASEKEARDQLHDIKGQLRAASEKYETLNSRFTELYSQYTKLQTELDERAASHVRELASFEQQKASLAEQFKVLSNDILEAKAKSLQESNKLTLSSVLAPFQQSIDSFKKEVHEIHHRETTQQGELRKELESLKILNQQITTEAHELSTALRGQKKLQGNWGELMLENVLDRSGLRLDRDYRREVNITTEDGRQRPDVVVYLPQDKHLIIDAKVSLNAYVRYVNAEDEAERTVALKDHVNAVSSRIKELADRDYYKLPGLNSPEMVFMFVPVESAFVEALKADETLFQQAIQNHVLVATPTTLLTSLNIVKQLWRYENQNKHTAALANRAEAVFKKLNGFLVSFEKIKKGLESATSAYSLAENQLVSGKGNLVKQVGDFKNLAPAIKAELPSYFTDKASLEIDFIPADIANSMESETNLPVETTTEIEISMTTFNNGE